MIYLFVLLCSLLGVVPGWASSGGLIFDSRYNPGEFDSDSDGVIHFIDCIDRMEDAMRMRERVDLFEKVVNDFWHGPMDTIMVTDGIGAVSTLMSSFTNLIEDGFQLGDHLCKVKDSGGIHCEPYVQPEQKPYVPKTPEDYYKEEEAQLHQRLADIEEQRRHRRLREFKEERFEVLKGQLQEERGALIVNWAMAKACWRAE